MDSASIGWILNGTLVWQCTTWSWAPSTKPRRLTRNGRTDPTWTRPASGVSFRTTTAGKRSTATSRRQLLIFLANVSTLSLLSHTQADAEYTNRPVSRLSVLQTLPLLPWFPLKSERIPVCWVPAHTSNVDSTSIFHDSGAQNDQNGLLGCSIFLASLALCPMLTWVWLETDSY